MRDDLRAPTPRPRPPVGIRPTDTGRTTIGSRGLGYRRRLVTQWFDAQRRHGRIDRDSVAGQWPVTPTTPRASATRGFDQHPTRSRPTGSALADSGGAGSTQAGAWHFGSLSIWCCVNRPLRAVLVDARPRRMDKSAAGGTEWTHLLRLARVNVCGHSTRWLVPRG